jgi:PhnB protein
MKKLDTMLRFAGSTEEAFEFYRSVFGGEFASLMRWKDMPDASFTEKLSESDKNAIMHIALPLGDENVLMGSDVLESMGHTSTPGDNICLSITTDSSGEADRCFEALVVNGQSIMPMEDAFWGSYFGMLVDKYGIEWMISCEHPAEQT